MRLTNKERYLKYNERVKKWKLDNPDKAKAIQVAYRRRRGQIPRSQYLSVLWKKENNPNWRGGTTDRTDALEWRLLRYQVWKRDKYICQECGIKCVRRTRLTPTTHHLIPFRLGGFDRLENLITLCKSCHIKIEWKTWNFAQIPL